MLIAWIGPLRGSNQIFCPDKNTLGTRGFSRERREFSVLAEGRHVFGRRPKPRAAKPREKPLARSGAFYRPRWPLSFFIGLHLHQSDWKSPTVIMWAGTWAFRAGHCEDLTETRNRARKVSGTQSTIKKLTWANGKVQILEVWFGLDQQEGLKFRGEDQKSEERFAFFWKKLHV